MRTERRHKFIEFFNMRKIMHIYGNEIGFAHRDHSLMVLFLQILDHVGNIHKSIIDFLYIEMHSGTSIILSMS